MKRQAQRVKYQHPEMGTLTVERLSPDAVTYQAARQIRHLIGVAYGDEFESPRAPVSVRLLRGRISGAYLQDSDQKIEEQQVRVEKALARGSSYWTLQAPTQVGQSGKNPRLDGLVKTTPSRSTTSQKLHLSPPNCYIDDILVRPGAEAGPTFRGVGSMLLHNALTHDSYELSATAVADTFRSGRSGPEFFSEAGFALQPDSTPPYTIFNRGEENEIHLPMERREARIQDVVDRLAARFEWLSSAEVEYST